MPTNSLNPRDVHAVHLRPAAGDDTDFIFATYEATLRPYVAWAWGWDGAFQRTGFWKHHPLEQLQLVTVEGERAGVMHVQEQVDAHFIRMIFLSPAFQGRGVGSRLLLAEAARARAEGKPLHLKVIKINPAKRLYERLGFAVIDENNVTWSMRLA